MANLLIVCTLVIASFIVVIDTRIIPDYDVPVSTQINAMVQIMQQIMQDIDEKRERGIYSEKDNVSYERAKQHIESYESESNSYPDVTTRISDVEMELMDQYNNEQYNNGKNKNNSRKRNMRKLYLRSFKKLLKKLAKLFRKTSNEIKI